jgi:4-amino-4-deoxy-L-arabinose transferase-like glycosyltransferase
MSGLYQQGARMLWTGLLQIRSVESYNSSGYGTFSSLPQGSRLMEQSRSEARFWSIFAAVTVAVILVAAIRWSLAHPYGIHWDEAEYLNNIWIDLQRLYQGNLHKLGGRILMSWGKPPAYRLLALPFLALFGFHTTMARLVSLAAFGLSSWFIYLATRRIGSKMAGAFAVLIFSLSPEVVSASIFFGTDPPLYLATSAMLYYLFVHWSDSSERLSTWIGLGLAIGLGFWAKASFALIALPVLAFALVVDYRKDRDVQSLVPITKAGALGALLAAPWWLLNARHAIAYAQYARGFVRNSLGSPSLVTWGRWLNTVFQALLGHCVSIFICLVVITCFREVFIRRRTILDNLQKTAIGACACAGVPIVLSQLSGTNHLLRHISPAVIPLAIAIGVLSDKVGWGRSGASFAASGVLFSVQLLMIVYPVASPNKRPVDLGFVNGSLPWRAMARFDQWDWKPIRDISDACTLDHPQISYLGNGRVFNPPSIQYPWVPSAFISYPNVTWLWRYEDGPLDWQKVMASAGQSDIVITAPHYVGEVKYKEDLDNQYNAEFAGRFSQDPRFRGPIRIEMGRFQPVEIDLFLRKTLVCRAGQSFPANRESGK